MSQFVKMAQSTSGRVALFLVYIIAVNLISGLVAVKFGYPSLWGNIEVFSEYAYPMIFTWAMTHWFSMLPLAYMVASTPLWEKATIIRWRWLLLAGLITCFIYEISSGRFHQTPFVLFFLVDMGMALCLSCLFYFPKKFFMFACLLLAILISVSFSAPIIYENAFTLYNRAKQQPTQETPKKVALALLSFKETIRQEARKEIHYYIDINRKVEPGKDPSPKEICDESRILFIKNKLENLENYQHLLKFNSQPWFESETKYWYPSGDAEFNENGEWRCNFTYPQPPL